MTDQPSDQEQVVREALGLRLSPRGYRFEVVHAAFNDIMAVVAGAREALARDFAANEDISTIQELDGLHGYERGVLDVQEFLATALARLTEEGDKG